MKKYLILTVISVLPLTGFADDNAAKLALAREAIAATQIDKMFDNMTGMFKQMALQQAQLPAEATPEQHQKFEAFMGQVMDVTMEEAKAMIGRMDKVYASVYSEAELKAMIAFFKSPEGQSMISKQPQVMAQVMPLAQEMQRSLLPKIQKLAEEFKDELAKAAPPAK
jgi:hypothetical protein